MSLAPTLLHQVGIAALWLMLQITLFTLVGVALYAAAGRRGPETRAALAAVTLTMLLAVSALAISPWPVWWNVSVAGIAGAEQPRDPSPPSDRLGRETSAAIDRPGEPAHPDQGSTPNAAQRLKPDSAFWPAFWQALDKNLSVASAPSPRPGWTWQAIGAAVLFMGIVAAAVRTLIGLLAVIQYRRTARRITDPGLVEQVDVLRARMSCVRPVTVCESKQISAPATIGWRKPLILLPPTWRAWSESDLQAVLAHELSHVKRGDFASGVIAHVTTALHFYHPLVVWLSERMRFEQELAADATGVEFSGGNESYVVSLARMALHQDDRALAWAARPFLPGRSTFMRRIEMLRCARSIRPAPYSRATRGLLWGVLAAAGIVVAGIRGPMGVSTPAVAAQNVASAAADDSQPFDLKFVPKNTFVLMAAKPARLLARDDKMRSMVEAMEKEMDVFKELGLRLSDLAEVRFMAIAPEQVPKGQFMRPTEAFMIRAVKPFDFSKLGERNMPGAEKMAVNGKTYFRVTADPSAPGRGGGYFMPDDRSIVVARTEEALMAIMSAVEGALPSGFVKEFARVADSDAALAFNVDPIRNEMESTVNRGGTGPQTGMMLGFAPLWREAETVVAGAKLHDKLKVNAYAICKTAEGATEVKDTVIAARVLASNMLPMIRAQANRPEPGEPQELAKVKTMLVKELESLLAQVKPTVEGNTVSLALETSQGTSAIMASVYMPAIAAAREAARRTQSTNNMRQIALAMHNYVDTYKAFPASSVLGPDGKTPHSWRVAILPFIEQQALYDQYKFDEPWDSEHNKKLIAIMPEIYRSPLDNGPAGNTSYFVLTGEHTIFPSQPTKPGKGIGFAKITDGTSNTILVVEAKRDIPWTKPEDIPFDKDQPLPKMGGLTRAATPTAFADGSVRLISNDVDENVLKALITHAGGEVVQIPPIDQPNRARRVNDVPQP